MTAGTLQTRKSILDLTDEDWERYFHAHFMLTVRACRAAIPHLIAAGGGTIVTNKAMVEDFHMSVALADRIDLSFRGFLSVPA